MRKRALALKLAVVGVLAAASVGIAASPASAYPVECFGLNYWHLKAEMYLRSGSLSAQEVVTWYGHWVRTADLMDQLDC
jgi:hypothetical protein